LAACSGKSDLARMLAAALGRHPLCAAHLVWVDCCAVPTDTLANARASLAAQVHLSQQPKVGR
jgi:hypothetical protein